MPTADQTTNPTLPPEILAALSDPDVCGYLDESGGPCENCIRGVAHDLAAGVTVAEVLADIEGFRETGERVRRIAQQDQS